MSNYSYFSGILGGLAFAAAHLFRDKPGAEQPPRGSQRQLEKALEGLNAGRGLTETAVKDILKNAKHTDLPIILQLQQEAQQAYGARDSKVELEAVKRLNTYVRVVR